MNERLKNFAMLSYNPYGEFDYEKFAELIVNECADMVAGSSLPDAYSEPVLDEIAEEMREWFGVSK